LTTLDQLQQLRDLGMVLTLYPDGTMRYKAPKGVLTPTRTLSEHKAALPALIEAFEECTAIIEYNSRLPPDAAERVAWACIHSARDV
jgi:hypothetical protein